MQSRTKTNTISTVIAAITAVLFCLVEPLIAQTQQVDVAGALANDQATVTSSRIDIGSIDNIFDGNTSTLARTANITRVSRSTTRAA